MTISDKIQMEINGLRNRLEILQKLQYTVAKLGLQDRTDATLYCDGIDWNKPSRELFTELKTFFPKGTRWHKEPALDGITYSTQVDGFNFRMWSAPPPPSCKVIYEEVMIPARVERVAKVVCKEPNEQDE